MRHLQDQVVKEMPSTVTLECELTKANVKVQWCRGTEPLERSPKYEIIAKGTVHQLILHDVTDEDISEYTAMARSKTSKANLSIEGE